MSFLSTLPYRAGHVPRCTSACQYCQSQPSLGCTVRTCQSPDTVTVDGFHGRRCALHPPVFDGAICVRLMRTEGAAAALRYLRVYAAREVTA